MNHLKENSLSEISGYQIQQFQALVTKLFQCCQERSQYQCERFQLPDAELRCLILFGEERYLTSKGIAYKMNVVNYCSVCMRSQRCPSYPCPSGSGA